MTTRTYRLDHDIGFAPNPFFGWCSLACCMSQLRQFAEVGDIIIGMAGSGAQGLKRIHPQLVFWMQVDYAMTFDEYWLDIRFQDKRPCLGGPKMYEVGDRTYRHESGEADWSQEESMHFRMGIENTKKHLAKDTSVDRILIGSRFTYWGGQGPAVPYHLIGLFPASRNHKCPKAGELLAELHDLAEVQTPRGLVGDPADWENQKYFDPPNLADFP